MAAFFCENCKQRVSPFSPIYTMGTKAVGPCCYDMRPEVIAFFQSLVPTWATYKPGAPGLNVTPFALRCYKFWNRQTTPYTKVVQMDMSFTDGAWNGEWKISTSRNRRHEWETEGVGWQELMNQIKSISK